MKIWCTKWLFTNGIEELESEETGEEGMVEALRQGGGYKFYLHGEGKDWHRTRGSAIARAEEMRIKKLKALDKQIKTISAMNFE